MRDIGTLYQQIQKELLSNTDKQQSKKNKTYHKHPSHKSLGIDAPKLRNILKDFKKDIAQLKCSKVLHLAERLAKKKIEEFVLAGNYVLENRLDCLVSSDSFLDQYANYFVSWSTVDDFCMDVLQPVLRKNRKAVLSLIKKWNKSSNLWKRRASVVAFTRSVGESGKFTDVALKLCDNLIQDKEDLVQKGVGWALKDIMRGDKQKVLSYVKKLRARGAPSAITLYAIRDLEGKERSEVLKIKPN